PKGRRYPGRRFAWIAIAPRAVIAHRSPFGAGPLAHRLEFSRRAVAIISAACAQQLSRDLGMPCSAGGLVDDVAVPGEPEPGQTIDDCRDRFFCRPCPVGVLDA